MTREGFELALQKALSKNHATNGMSEDEILEMAQSVTESMEDDLGDSFTEAFDSESIEDEDEDEDDVDDDVFEPSGDDD